MTPTRHPLVEDYLAALRHEATRLDAADAHELLADIEAHLNESVPPDASEAEARNALDRLGRPAELVDEAVGGRPPAMADAPSGSGSGWPEALAIFALIAAEVLAIIFPVAIPLWILGIVCLAIAKRWSPDLKLRGFVFLGLGMPLAWLLTLLAAVPSKQCQYTQEAVQAGQEPSPISTQCQQLYPSWVGYGVLALLVIFFVFQVITVRKLARAAR